MDKIITTDQLRKKLVQHEPVFILDVRPTEQRQEWHIAGSQHLDAYKRLNAGDNTVLDEIELPEDTTVVTVCAAGRISMIASDVLRTKGFNAVSLEGGMKAWNYAWNTAELQFQNGPKIIQVRRVAKGCLSYVVGSGSDAIVIDASLDPQIYLGMAAENGWRIKYVTDTHIHADYVSRTRELSKASGAKHVLLDRTKVNYEFTPISAGSSLSVGEATFEFIHTPGHTLESASLKINDLALLTGDTLFIDSVGRPDLKADPDLVIQKSKSLYRSLKGLLTMNPSIFVLPAHTSKAILFDAKIIGAPLSNVRNNVSLLGASEEEFVSFTSSRVPPPPPNYQTIASLNKEGSYEGHTLADLEAGANRCAIS